MSLLCFNEVESVLWNLIHVWGTDLDQSVHTQFVLQHL